MPDRYETCRKITENPPHEMKQKQRFWKGMGLSSLFWRARREDGSKQAASNGQYCYRVCLCTVSQAETCQNGRVIDSVWFIRQKERQDEWFYGRHCKKDKLLNFVIWSPLDRNVTYNFVAKRKYAWKLLFIRLAYSVVLSYYTDLSYYTSERGFSSHVTFRETKIYNRVKPH